ncbi:MAG: undecaprenyl-diphosphate phosphatase [Chloroflexi bacterium]|nr:undecaprenyl-diphosphate phosphatase [Chloroflexota bacterium]
MAVAALLGLLQGITEWLPVSSEGVTSAVYSIFYESSLSEAVAFALWLHIGTALSALIALRKEVRVIISDAVSNPLKPSPLIVYLVVATAVSALVGFPLLLAVEELSGRVGAASMGLVGLLMFITGGLQLRKRQSGTRSREDISPIDAVLAGLAQGFAVLPGLSRSGLTVATLLARQVDRREALVLSFLMSIPASLGAGLYASINSGFLTSGSGLLAAAIACVVGFATIRGLLVVAERVNFAAFVIIVGAAILLGAVWQGFNS